MTYLAITIALSLSMTWAIRGGSFGPLKERLPRWATLLVTPLALVLPLALVHTGWDLWSALLFPVAALAFFAAQADGWGRQMDLGDDPKPDNETGRRLRDMIWEKKSSLPRDLAGLYMRFLQFTPAALALGYISPIYALPVVALMVFTPLLWLAERQWIKGTKLYGKLAWVEYATGIMLSLATITAITL